MYGNRRNFGLLQKGSEIMHFVLGDVHTVVHGGRERNAESDASLCTHSGIYRKKVKCGASCDDLIRLLIGPCGLSR